ncbi:MAG: tRNA preQ1(34) S-adenosylmethionine ribosyltransferase-isomerase QueA [Patescibacteria group bacterium]
MKLSDFDYQLPKNLIAQNPIRPRDHSRLLVFIRRGTTNSAHPNKNKDDCKILHKYFYNIIDYLQPGDVLVLNNSKVFPARLLGRKKTTGGQIEVFLNQKIKGNIWQCLLAGHSCKIGLEIIFNNQLGGQVIKDNKDGTWEIKFNKSGKELMRAIKKIGQVPLPPYIKRLNKKRQTGLDNSTPRGVLDAKAYQTVYADNKKFGSVAAPTAGFHFTPELIKKLKTKGVQIEFITLHVGLGTFAPVKVEKIEEHKMHAEIAEVKKSVIGRILKAKKEEKRIIAVGTTSVRVLEGLVAKELNGTALKTANYKLPITTFIYPGYRFKIVDAMITNFHLPKSTLIMLVCAFAGRKNIKKAYQVAISKKYRFYSYGDAMLVI